MLRVTKGIMGEASAREGMGSLLGVAVEALTMVEAVLEMKRWGGLELHCTMRTRHLLSVQPL